MNQKNISTVICEHRFQYLQQINGLKTIHLNGVLTENPDYLSKKIQYPICVNSFQLNVNGLSVEKSGKQILKDINFSFQSGQIIAMVGRNGAGKTTLFRAIMGLQHCSGNLEIITKKEKKEDPGFNMIFQNPDTQLFNASVREEILYKVSNPNNQLYEWLLDVLNLKKYEDSPPLLLSEGEKRRVALATALMRENRHGILLDEPSLGQDEYHKKILIHVLRALANSGYLVMFSTHDLELASQADQLVLLTPEGVISQGPVKEVFQDTHSWEKMGLIIPPWMKLHV
jgi:energy-coupling factor transport system ATP-binding protein